jgi:hypothetical protein
MLHKLKEFLTKEIIEWEEAIKEEYKEFWEEYYSIKKHVMNIDEPDPSYSVWFQDWLNHILRKLNSNYNKTFDYEKFVVECDKAFWDLEHLQRLADIYDYSDAFECHQDLLNAMDCSFTVTELYWEWTVAYYELWDEFIIIDKYDLCCDSYEELYKRICRLENLVLNLY